MALALKNQPEVKKSIKQLLVRTIQSPFFAHVCTSAGATACPEWLSHAAKHFGVRSLKKLNVPLQASILAAEIAAEITKVVRQQTTPTLAIVTIGESIAATGGAFLGCSAGTYVGSYAGSIIGPGGAALGAATGCLVGSIAGGSLASTAVGQFLLWLFDLPADRQLAEALQHFGVGLHSSNEVINKRYHQLALKAHPDRGGSQEEFVKLGVYLDIIREHRKLVEEEGVATHTSCEHPSHA